MTRIFLMGLIFLSACDGDKSGDTAEILPESLGQCDADSMVVWSEVEPIFQSHCTACHASELEASDRQGAPVGIDYDQAEHARLNSELTWQLIRTGQMPLQGTVPFEDAMMVWEWLSCGGPE
jgi:uncharacterized membrane protein